MLDIVLMAECVWCALWIGLGGRRRALLHAGGVLAATYVATILSDWLAHTFAPPASGVFQWLEDHIDASAVAAAATKAAFLPPLPAGTDGTTHIGWIAVHVVRSVTFTLLTAAVFTIFVVMGHLRDALWDRTEEHEGAATVTAVAIALGCGCWLTGVTAMLLADLSWLRELAPLSAAVEHSYVMHVVGQVLQWWDQHPRL